MSRHRDIRKLDYDEEYDEAHDDAVYGHSVDDNDYGMSPSTEQYLFSECREGRYGFGAYFPETEKIKEEEEDTSEYTSKNKQRASNTYEKPRLSSEDEAKLNSVLDIVRDVVGDQFPDSELVCIIIEHEYDPEASLNALLTKSLSSGNERPSLTPKIAGETELKRDQQTSGIEQDPKAASSVETLSPIIVTTPARSVIRGFTPISNGVSEENREINGEENYEELLLPQVDSIRERESPSLMPKIPAKIRDKEMNVEKKYSEHRSRGKTLLNLVVVGHVDAGKSTLMGHLLYLQGNVTQRTMHKYEEESRKVGKQSFMYAWVLDDTEEERNRGITVDLAQRIFETESKVIILLDAPGHRDFIPNMITGAVRADVAVLVVDASVGGFEAGFESGGQTREHAILTRSLGISQLAVAINKLDTVTWNQERFEEIKKSLRNFLKIVGFRDSEVTYVPCSGLTGENLVKPPTDNTLLSWYHGPTLLQAIDKLKAYERPITQPVRMCISDVYKGQGYSMFVSGKLETGYTQNGDKLILMPRMGIIGVKAVQVENSDAGFAFAGDHATLNISGVEPSTVHVGDFLCDPQDLIPQATRIQAKIVVFNIMVPIIKGSQFDFHYQSVREIARVHKLTSLLHKSTGQVVKQRPRALVKNSSAVIELEFDRPLCMQVYRDYKELGRFMLRNDGITVAAGMVTQAKQQPYGFLEPLYTSTKPQGRCSVPFLYIHCGKI